MKKILTIFSKTTLTSRDAVFSENSALYDMRNRNCSTKYSRISITSNMYRDGHLSHPFQITSAMALNYCKSRFSGLRLLYRALPILGSLTLYCLPVPLYNLPSFAQIYALHNTKINASSRSKCAIVNTIGKYCVWMHVERNDEG